MKRVLLMGLFILAVAGCESKKETTEPTAEATAESAQPAGMVEVSAAGDPFEPPIQKSQLPDGVYYCDMGTVHYARAEQGDNRCPLCNMMLTYKRPAGEAPAAEAAPAAEDHAGHDHD